MSSVGESDVTNKMKSNSQRNASSMSKIKSPSNSYTQFYKQGVLVGIEGTSPNSRRISGEIIIEGIPIDDIWHILTDYDNLSTHVPNLVESKVISNGSISMNRRPRVYQRGAQRIFGFEFGADVTMDMSENVHHGQGGNNAKVYSIDFECVNSQFFSEFDGSWILEEYSEKKTMVRYVVDVRPKGPVPVAALEWRIKEDVPVNILEVSRSAQAIGAGRREEERHTLDRRDDEQIPRAEPMSVDLSLPTPPQPQLNPLQQLTNQAAQNLKQTAKSFLPNPVYSSARQAFKTVSDSNPRARVKESRKNIVPSMSLNPVRRKKESIKDTIVDWYEDETMAMYLKDS